MLNPEELLTTLGAFASSYFKDIKSKELTLSGESYRYLEAGTGPTVIFMHGVAGSRNYWRGVIGHLAADYHVISLDIPSLSMSTHIGSRRATLSRLSEWLHLFIKSKNLKDVHFATHSFSAGIAAYYASIYPENVKSICWVSLPQWFKVESGEEPLIFRLVGDMENAAPEEQYDIWKNAIFHKEPTISKLMESYHKKFFHQYKQRIVDVLSDLKFSYKQLPPRLSKIECDVLVIWGEHSAFEMKGLYSKVKEWIPAVRREVIPDCGHAVSIEKVNVFTEMYREFLQGIELSIEGSKYATTEAN